MVASSKTGACAVFDPLWDVDPYIATARRNGLVITHVFDSHSHADHVSGARRLAQATSAGLYLPEHMETAYEGVRVKDGDRICLGEVVLEVVHVPGHRPEQINLLVRDRSRGDEPWCILTADFLLVGDISRPDLAQDGREGAERLFLESLPRLLALPDFVEAYPGHVAGST
jgi:hydroxyacylglutathione hydrolase